MAINLVLNEFIDKNDISRYKLAQLTEIDFQTIDRYYKNKVVRYDSYVLNKICNALNCDITDIVKYEKD